MFGTCPRVLCEHQPLLPIGQSEVPNTAPLRMYCPRCQDVYLPQKAKFESIDGAYFGPYFAHMFVVNYPLLSVRPRQEFSGTIFGFRMHSSSGNHPPKLAYSAEKNELQMVPRPAASFSDPKGRKAARTLISNVPPKGSSS